MHQSKVSLRAFDWYSTSHISDQQFSHNKRTVILVIFYRSFFLRLTVAASLKDDSIDHGHDSTGFFGGVGIKKPYKPFVMYNPIHPPMHDRPLSANGGTRWRRVEFGIHLLGANFPCLASSSFAIVSHHGHNRNVAKRFAPCAHRRQSKLRNNFLSLKQKTENTKALDVG